MPGCGLSPCLPPESSPSASAVTRSAPIPPSTLGEYLAIEDGAQVVLLPVPVGILHIGRSSAAGLTLDDATVSRRHAVIVRDRDGTRILDDRSLNGVVVRGVRVSDAVLRDGDVIELGRVRLHYLRRAG